MNKINVAVLRGGPSFAYENSLVSGQAVIDALDESKYNVIDVFIDKDAVWHYRGLPVKPIELLEKVDVAFNALHGEYGEDGQVQTILEQSGVSFTGPKSFDAAVAFHKALSLSKLKDAGVEGLKIQGQKFINIMDLADDDLKKVVDDIFSVMAPPYVVKPVKPNPAFGIAIANTRDELFSLLPKIAMEYEEVVIEEFIFGTEISISMAQSLRDEDVYVAPPVEILKKDKKILDSNIAFSEATAETVRMPANISDEIKIKLLGVARDIFNILGARHYARANMMVSRDKDLYFLGLNSLPGLGPNALLPMTFDAVGIDFIQFIEHVINIAMAD